MLSWKGKEGVVKMHGVFLETPAWITRALGHEVVKNQAGYWRIRNDLAEYRSKSNVPPLVYIRDHMCFLTIEDGLDWRERVIR